MGGWGRGGGGIASLWSRRRRRCRTPRVRWPHSGGRHDRADAAPAARRLRPCRRLGGRLARRGGALGRQPEAQLAAARSECARLEAAVAGLDARLEEKRARESEL